MRIPLLAALAAALTACSVGDIGAVRELPYPVDSTYTTGQALDDRAHCEAVDWSAIDDERGRRIVVYTCVLADAPEYFAVERDKKIEEINRRHARETSRVEAADQGFSKEMAWVEDVSVSEDRFHKADVEVVAGLRAFQLSLAQGTATFQQFHALNEGRWLGSWFEGLQRAFREQDVWQARMQNQSSEQGRAYTRPQLEAANAALSAQMQVSARQLAEVVSAAEAELAKDAMDAEASQSAAAIERQRTVDELKAKQAEFQQRKPQLLAELEAKRLEAVQAMEERYRDIVATETYQWAVSDAGPQLIYGGHEIVNGAGDQIAAVNYGGPLLELRLKRALDDRLTNFAEYMSY